MYARIFRRKDKKIVGYYNVKSFEFCLDASKKSYISINGSKIFYDNRYIWYLFDDNSQVIDNNLVL